jgi:serine/threonine protein phosphatase 1
LDIHYAIGDVHGRDDLLEKMHARIEAWHRWRHPDVAGTIVYLGDYVDRGYKSAEVIDRVMRGVPGLSTIALKGNHEQLMLDCLTTDDRETWMYWLDNGGAETMASLGLQHYDACDPVALARALGAERIAWLENLTLTHRAGDYLFVHAGIVPGRPLAEQKPKDLIWIRHHFLDNDADHGFVVVHGHTPSDVPEWKANRINVDTGAVMYGRLTTVVLGAPDSPRFMTIAGEPGPGPE